MKKSFTLIEVMISIVIFSILVLFTSKVIASLNLSLNSLNKVYYENIKQSLLIKTLYADILASKNINLENRNKNYSILSIQTTNSLYNISMPYVIWYVSKNNNSLMRLESSQKIVLPINNEDIFLDKFTSNLQIFKVYKKKNYFFVYIKNKKSLFFEFRK